MPAIRWTKILNYISVTVISLFIIFLSFQIYRHYQSKRKSLIPMKQIDPLRYVRIICGDWTRICGGNWQDLGGRGCGIYLDPPYSVKDRASNIYIHDSRTVALDVQKWCLERGDRKTYRIVLSGYFEEHQELLKYGWSYYQWTAGGGYGNLRNTKDNQNRFKECLFFSPHCQTKAQQLSLF